MKKIKINKNEKLIGNKKISILNFILNIANDIMKNENEKNIKQT